ncbi:MAG: SDR family oxidoreductase [Candidatus Sumerlaeia bacterium]|nr:SDR family oxidoreductase [Candidatus Sumerlaeia bacterium]
MNVAVITGASMGLGEEFARQLAQRRQNLVLVARSGDKLEALASELSQRYRVHAFPFVCDLSKAGAPEQVVSFLEEKGLHPTWLINNAGFGLTGALDTMDPEPVRDMMMVNMVTLAELTRALLPMLRLGRDSRIINIASTAAFQPIPYFTLYAATKVFVLNFSEGLAEELQRTDVKVLALCPGPTPTNFAATSGIDPKLFERGQSAHEVVRMGLRASDSGRVVLVTQRVWAVWLGKLLPRMVIRKIAGMVARSLLKRHQGKNW